VGKKNLLGVSKEPDLNLAQELMMYFLKKVAHYFTLRRLVTFYPKRVKRK